MRSTPPPSNVIDAGDVLVIGAGLAGLYTALKLAPLRVTVLSHAHPRKACASAWAQGGIAAALGADDAPALHAADTIAAGAGIVDPQIAHILADEAAARIADLAELGVPFDRGDGGRFALGREAAHSRARIVHVCGDRAGAAIMTALVNASEATPSIRVFAGLTARELAVADGKAVGAFAVRARGTGTVYLQARHVVLATGGIGGLYEVTTNPLSARGEGLGMAARAGVTISDPEFVQFHPTAMRLGIDPAPLATEALRGEGATLVTGRGERFMPSVHERAELAPRDVVARAIHARIEAGETVYLDCRAAVGAAMAERFPTVYAACRQAGLDPAREPVPVAPAAHYHMGGVATDAHGRTSLDGLWACGEVAATGAHGANRLASNSLLEGLVFGARIARDIRGREANTRPSVFAPAPGDSQQDAGAAPVMQRLRRMMTAELGLVRNAAGMAHAAAEILRLERAGGGHAALLDGFAVAKLIAAAALKRRESRGSHFRGDFPAPDDAFRHRSFLTLAEAEAVVRDAAERDGNLDGAVCVP